MQQGDNIGGSLGKRSPEARRLQPTKIWLLNADLFIKISILTCLLYVNRLLNVSRLISSSNGGRILITH